MLDGSPRQILVSGGSRGDRLRDKSERIVVGGDLLGLKRGLLHVAGEIVAEEKVEVVPRRTNAAAVGGPPQHRHAALDVAGHQQASAIFGDGEHVVFVERHGLVTGREGGGDVAARILHDEQHLVGAAARGCQLDRMAGGAQRPVERRRIARIRGEIEQIFTEIHHREELEADREARIDGRHMFQAGAGAIVFARIDRAKRVGRLEDAAIARIAGRRGEVLGAVAGANDAVGLQQRVGQRPDDCFLGRARVGPGRRWVESARPRDRALGGVDQLEQDRGRGLAVFDRTGEPIVGMPRGRGGDGGARGSVVGRPGTKGDVDRVEAGKRVTKLFGQRAGHDAARSRSTEHAQGFDVDGRQAVAARQSVGGRPRVYARHRPRAGRAGLAHVHSQGRAEQADTQHDPHDGEPAGQAPECSRRHRCDRRGRRHAAAGKRRDIASARQLDRHRIIDAFPRIVACHRAPQAGRLDADDRIDLRIESGIAAERLDADRIALEAGAVAGQRFFDNEAQERAELRRAAKGLARDDPFERGAHVGFARPSCGPGRYRHRGRFPESTSTGFFALV